MSKWRVKIQYDAPTALQRDAVAATVALAFVGKDIYNTPRPPRTGTSEGRFTYMRDTRFNTQGDAEAVYAAVSTDLVAVLGISGKVSLHICTHDDASVKSCNTAEVSYQETVF